MKPKSDPPPRPATLPEVGSDIYVPSQWYMSHGTDDTHGGLAKVSKVDHSCGSWFVEVKELPGHSYNWACIGPDQEKLRKEFGTTRAHPDPDDHPDANRW